MDSTPLWHWINERHATYVRKSLREGVALAALHVPEDYKTSPSLDAFIWASRTYLTRDPIISQYRFCNVFRELDRVTAWIRYNIRRRYKDHPDLWLMLAIARYINWPPTLEWVMDHKGPHGADVGLSAWPGGDNFHPSYLAAALDEYQETGAKVYTWAYTIRAESNPNAEWYAWSKNRYIAEVVIGRLWEDRDHWRNLFQTDRQQTLQTIWSCFQQPRYIGWGPFMAYQVVVDMRWTRLLEGAPDINTWAALGPGSRRGLNRLSGRPLDYPLKQAEGLEEMRALHAEQDQHRAPWVPPIDLSDIQNALCETDKWLRVRNGEGKPRSLYKPGRGS